MNDYVIYTDGAYSSSRKQGGSAFLILKDGEKVMEWSKCWKGGTNNTAEILAIYSALSVFKNPVNSITVYSDSQYCLGCIFEGWTRKANVKIWKLFDKMFENLKTLCPNIKGVHIDGHSKKKDEHSQYNAWVDRLAVDASHE